jgi:aldehyde dehydrogenase
MSDTFQVDRASTQAECLVAGEWVSGTSRSEIINPADLNDVVGSAPLLGIEEVDRAVRGAVAAQPGWAALSAVDRAATVRRAVEAASGVPGLAELLTREQGKVLAESQAEVGGMSYFAQYFETKAHILDEGELRQDDDNLRVTVFDDPVGVVAIITPFNWPVGITMAKVIPALIAGNALVIKPAPTTPLAMIAVVRAMAPHLPPGLISVLTGDLAVPQALIAHPLVRMVSFTGSTRTGRAVAAAASSTIKNVSLELGGNDPAILLRDVELDESLFAALAANAFITAGQVCFAIKRLYVPEALVGKVAAGLIDILDGYVVGSGLEPTTSMGPLNNRSQRDIVSGLVADAAQRGTVRTCGTLAADPDNGWFLRPAIVTGLDESSPLVSEEQFGPALPLIAYGSEDEVIARANNSEYGLTASVWSVDEDRATAMARRLQAGLTCVNSHGGAGGSMDAPFGGVKQSGVGRDLAIEGLLSYTEKHSVSVRHR